MKSLDGVESVKLRWKDKTFDVRYDPERVTEEQLWAAVTKCGFWRQGDPEPERVVAEVPAENTKATVLRVEGMT